jgi:S-adenosylmethionine:tRNA ribosyltransferase-isomerase
MVQWSDNKRYSERNMIPDSLKVLNLKDYYYDLPEERIAQFPVKERDSSNLLIYNKGAISKDIFRNITDYLPADSLLVFNNTRVISARLLFKKNSGACIEILCLEPLSPPGYDISFSSASPVEWKCIVGNLKKWKKGNLSIPFICNGKQYLLSARRICPEGEAWRIQFTWSPGDLSFGEVIESAGHIPLPPYIKREDIPEDYIRYQTVYSRIYGSVAAPTAGLHFTKRVLDDIIIKGIDTVELTLHVGAGTFQPVRQNNILNHKMHREHFSVSKDTIESLLKHEGRIIPVGTTSVRTLETIYWLGVKCTMNDGHINEPFFISQWDTYRQSTDITFKESFDALLKMMEINGIQLLNASTEIMIIPGYRFRTFRGMVTNFHQPGSTLLLLVAAFTGDDWKKIYRFAFENNFRFLSYGDSSLLMK